MTPEGSNLGIGQLTKGPKFSPPLDMNFEQGNPQGEKTMEKAIEKAMVSWFFLHLSISPGPQVPWPRVTGDSTCGGPVIIWAC